METVRPGIKRPEDRPATVGRPADRTRETRLPQRPPYDPNRPPISRTVRSEPVPRRAGWGTALALACLVLTVVGGAGLAYLASAPPVGLIRDQVIAQVKAKTGRTLTIAGPATFSVASGLTLKMSDVALSGPPGMAGGAFVEMAGLDANVRLWPLLWRQISVDQLVLRQPVFQLRVDKAGKRNWDFAELSPPALIQYAQAQPASPSAIAAPGSLPDAVKDFVENASDPDNPSPQMKAKLARLDELTLGDVRIEGGTVNYADARTGANQQLTGIDVTVGLKSIASPLDAIGKLDYRGQSIGFDLKLASPKALLQDRPAKLSLAVKGTPLDARYQGTVTPRTTLELDGDVSGKGASLRALLAWLGHPMPPADGFGQVSVAGKLRTTATTVGFSDANLGLDGATATGSIMIDTSLARPRMTANLKISELDLNRYSLAIPAAAPTVGPATFPRTAPAKPTDTNQAPVSAKSIEDLINGTAGPQVKGYTKRSGWSGEPIALDALGLVDVDAKLSVARLLYRDIKVGQSSVTVALKNKVLKTNFDDVQLYEGRGRGFVTIDANPPAPVVGANLSVDGVAAQTLLKDVADFELLAGVARVTVAVGAQGRSEAELVQTANGKADFAFSNGAIVGYNIPGTIRGLTQGRFSGFDKSAAEKTDFSELMATFTITNGIATNQDLRMTGPLLRVTGTGTVALPTQSIDYTLKPKFVASLQGQGGVDALSGIEVPVRVTGPWAKPQFTPDASGILKDPNKAIQAVKEIGRQLKEDGTAKQWGDALKGLLKKENGDGTGGEPQASPKQLFDKFFKKP